MAVGAALLLTAATAHAQIGTAAELTLRPHCGPDGFPDYITIGEKVVRLPEGEGRFRPLKAALGRKKPNIRLIGDTNTSYRCIGGIIFSLQRIGISKLVFVTAPGVSD